MAATYESSQTAGVSNTNARTVTKPTSLAVGDVLVAHLGADGGNSLSTPAGWTNVIDTTADSNLYMKVMYKVADSSDVAASNFTFTFTGTSNVWAALTRLSGVFQMDASSSTTYANSSTNPKTTTTVTPGDPDSIFLLFANAEGNGANPAFSGYSMVTSDPTWTEAYDISGSNRGGAMGYANRTAVTASGDLSVSITNQSGATDAVIAVLVFDPKISDTDTPSAITVYANTPTPHQPIKVTANVPAPTAAASTATWQNVTKSTTTWNNVSKS